MYFSASFAAALLVVTPALARPHPKRTLGGLTLDKLLQIAPKSASCDGAAYPAECHTATQALPQLVEAFQAFDITHPSEQAALVATMAYESAEFAYNKNHFPAPGVPGQGTKAMMMPQFTREYAEYLGFDITADAQTVADKVETTEYTFGAAAWYLTEKCQPYVREGIWGGDEVGWEQYITHCLGTTVDEGRRQYWVKAIQALGAD